MKFINDKITDIIGTMLVGIFAVLLLLFVLWAFEYIFITVLIVGFLYWFGLFISTKMTDRKG